MKNFISSGVNKMLPKILVVEDCPELQELYKEALRGKAEMLTALSVRRGKELFEKHADIALIIMDHCVPENENEEHSSDTIMLTKYILSRGFSGPIVATSSLPEFRKNQIAAGCTHECTKPEVPKKIKELLGI